MMLDWLHSFKFRRKTRVILSLSGLFCYSVIKYQLQSLLQCCIFSFHYWWICLTNDFVCFLNLYPPWSSVCVLTFIPQSIELRSSRVLLVQLHLSALEAQCSVNGTNTHISSLEFQTKTDDKALNYLLVGLLVSLWVLPILCLASPD